MANRGEYRRYDPEVKAAIAMTGRLDLFPELKIPRMTAQHWVDQKYVIRETASKPLAVALLEAKSQLDFLEGEVKSQKALFELYKDVITATESRIPWKRVTSHEIRTQILGSIEKAMKQTSLTHCLEVLGLSRARYKRWRRMAFQCDQSMMKICLKSAIQQLTFEEVQTMKRLTTSKEYAHFSQRSLMLYAKKQGWLFCSEDTWRKYRKKFSWKRPHRKQKKKLKKTGVRAKTSNEIWHMDISYFILPNKTKLYIQMVVDNYSRYIIAWQVLESYGGEHSRALLKEALRNRDHLNEVKTGDSTRLIVDGGSENLAKPVRELEGEGRFRKEVARYEIDFSNSMIEAVFRSAKHNYLLHCQIDSYRKLVKHVKYWVKEYNEKIPHSSFSGETPLERYLQGWNHWHRVHLKTNAKIARELRVKTNKKRNCEKC